MPGQDFGALFVTPREILKHIRRVMGRIQTQKDEPDFSAQIGAADDPFAHLLERLPGERTAVGIGAVAVEKRKQGDRPGRVAGEFSRETVAFKHDPERHALNMVEPVAPRRRKSETGACPRGNGQARLDEPSRSDQAAAKRAKETGSCGPHRDAARPGTSSEALST